MKADNPIYFFEHILTKDGINSMIKKFRKKYLSGEYTISSINEESLNFTIFDTDSEGKEHFYNVSFQDFLKPLMKKEFYNSLSLIKQYYQREDISNSGYQKYLNSIFNEIQYLINNNLKILRNHPYILAPLEELIIRINEGYFYGLKNDFRIDTRDLKIQQKDYMTNPEIVDAIFGYLSGYNEKKEKIMDDSQFDLMISYINYFVDNLDMPQLKGTIKHINITKELLRFSFYVLHKELYGTNKRKRELYDFMYLVFDDFDKNTLSENSLHSKFSVCKDIQNEGFISPIIRDYLDKR
ncbi:hypothetical protein [Gaetbulibacter sp. NE]|uniref:hypothetical protein n=1 Tax=Gaetbulibacter sp. NE TaxID=2982307 RepID=UPI0021D2D0AE|nr:hypothetical protein [Gaetbulibacter sp. NE]